jgi:hypothetical protein
MEMYAVMPKLFYPGDDKETSDLINAMIAAKYFVNRLSQVHLKFKTFDYRNHYD